MRHIGIFSALAKRLASPKAFIFGTVPTLENEKAMYQRFIEYNSKEDLLKTIKEKALTTNILSARFITPDGSLIKAPTTNHINVINTVLDHAKGFEKEYWRTLRLPSRCKLILIKFFLKYTSTLRIHTNEDSLCVQVFTCQNISEEQWNKINYLIKVLSPKLFAWDLEYEVKGKRRAITKEEMYPTNNLSLKLAYNKLRKENFKGKISKSITILS